MSHFWHEISRNWQAILTPIVSVAVGLISWLQWRTAKRQWETAEKQAETAKNRLRFDLFERRIAVYDALMTLAPIAIAKGDVTLEQQRTWESQPEEQNSCSTKRSTITALNSVKKPHWLK